MGEGSRRNYSPGISPISQYYATLKKIILITDFSIFYQAIGYSCFVVTKLIQSYSINRQMPRNPITGGLDSENSGSLLCEESLCLHKTRECFPWSSQASGGGCSTRGAEVTYKQHVGRGCGADRCLLAMDSDPTKCRLSPLCCCRAKGTRRP